MDGWVGKWRAGECRAMDSDGVMGSYWTTCWVDVGCLDCIPPSSHAPPDTPRSTGKSSIGLFSGRVLDPWPSS